MKFITENFSTIILPFITLMGGWLGNRGMQKWKGKHAKNEATGGELNNITKNFELYQKLIDDLDVKFKNRILDLEDDLERVKTLNEELRKTVSNYEKYIKKLKLKLTNYEELGGQD